MTTDQFTTAARWLVYRDWPDGSYDPEQEDFTYEEACRRAAELRGEGNQGRDGEIGRLTPDEQEPGRIPRRTTPGLPDPEGT